MAKRTTNRPKLVESAEAGTYTALPDRHAFLNQVDLAYDRIEELIVNCKLKPGRFLAMQDFQDLVALGRTPVHQAISRLAADTLVFVRPRHGVQIAPIDLARERVLLRLRRDIERFVIRLATERSGPSERNHMLHLRRLLREQRDQMTLARFNAVDRRVNRLIIAAAGEPFVEHSLRPLHTIFRRIGWLYHTQIGREANLQRTIDCHALVLDAVANRHVDKAIAASDELIDFVDSMFDVLEREIDPGLLDCSVGFLDRS
jgi:DNA-binding GntR family transcriptional regulator